MSVQHVAAVNVSGADHSCWNGLIGTTPDLADDGMVVLGEVTWDNAIHYHEKLVKQPLQEMFDHAGEEQDDRTLLRYRHAIGIVFHENTHLLAAAGTDRKSSQSIYQVSPAIKAIDEGVREAFSHSNLDPYIDELQLEQVAPRIKDVVCPSKYPRFTPATVALAHQLGRRSGLGSNEALRRLAIVTPSALWPAAAHLLFEANGLHRVVPDRAALVARSEIEAAMKRQFARLADVGDGLLLTTRAKSVMVGNDAFAAGQRVTDRLRRQYGDVPVLDGVVPLHSAHKLASGNRGERDTSAPTDRGRTPEAGR
ncbi:hypothetical protein AB0F43_06940 [Kribbella sp. NPDC023972]|uniref:hypothetical protein n=1 Tax=Kribbella sp. NPDC023972 TaxID=3154795 RepID=UPI0033E8C0E5